MQKNYVAMQGRELNAILAPFKKRLDDAADNIDKQHAQGDLAGFTGLVQSALNTVIALPDRPIPLSDFPKTIDLGGTKVILEAYQGHTIADVTAHIPDQNILFTGDLLFDAKFPVTFDANVSGWRAALAKFASYDKDTLFVPGHGELCGQEAIADQRALFRRFGGKRRENVQSGSERGRSIQALYAAAKIQRFPHFRLGLLRNARVRETLRGI